MFSLDIEDFEKYGTSFYNLPHPEGTTFCMFSSILEDLYGKCGDIDKKDIKGFCNMFEDIYDVDNIPEEYIRMLERVKYYRQGV